MTRRRVVVIGVLVALVGVLTFRCVVWVDVGERCYLFIRVSLVGYDNTAVKRALQTLKHGSPEDYHDLEAECYREDDRILRALVQFES